MKNINKKRFFLWGAIVLVVELVIGNLLYFIPIVSNIYKRYEGHPSTKTMDYFGGLNNWLFINMVFSIVFIVIMLCFWLLIYKRLPSNIFGSGILFGLILWVIKALPEAFNQWMLFIYPTQLIITQLVVTLVSLLIFGLSTSFFFKKMKVAKASK